MKAAEFHLIEMMAKIRLGGIMSMLLNPIHHCLAWIDKGNGDNTWQIWAESKILRQTGSR